MNRGFVGHADLARIFSEYKDAPRDLIASFLEWEYVPPKHMVMHVDTMYLDGIAKAVTTSEQNLTSGTWPTDAAVTQFWRPTRFTARSVLTTAEYIKQEKLKAGKRDWKVVPSATQPIRTPLCPWPALVPRLRAGLSARKQGSRIDWDCVVEQTASGKFVRRLPYSSLKRWGESVQIIFDRSDRLTPFWGDQDDVLSWLKRLIPEHGLKVIGGSSPTDGEFPSLGQHGSRGRVLVLGDLGCLQLHGQRLQEEWRTWGQQLLEGGCHPIALVPCTVAQVPASLRQTFSCYSWQRMPLAHVSDTAERRTAVEQLLTLLAPAIRIEPGLLRDVRALLTALGTAADDASLESEFWQDSALVSRHCVAATIDPEQAKQEWMPKFEAQSEAVRKAVLDCIRNWRQSLPPEIWQQEINFRLAPASRALVPLEDREHADAFLLELSELSRGSSEDAIAWLDYFWRARSRVTSIVEEDPVRGPILREIDRVCFPDNPLLVNGLDPGEIKRRETTLTLNIRQQGGELAFVPVQVGDNNPRLPGSHLGFLRTTNRELRIDTDWQEAISSDEMPPMRRWTAPSTYDKWNLSGSDKKPPGIRKQNEFPPKWASNSGRDDFGFWAEFVVKNNKKSVTQRMRWIPPGTFLMGSPESDKDAFGDERPLHTVTLTEGYWLFDTPCTQKLWSAVMGGKNPSYFKHDHCPVEQVSFYNVQKFLTQINRLVPGLDLTLPTEAQWEYACRAGTTEPRYGPLNEVAWYWRNSNSKTHGIALKQANAWGLFDMLGNVWEWCRDGQRQYFREAAINPVGTLEAGSERVIRGGSWGGSIQEVRAARRLAYLPGYWFNNVGFRCLISGLSQGKATEKAEVVRAALGSGQKAEPGHLPEQASGMTRLVVRDSEPAIYALPKTPRFRILSDVDELILEKSTPPEWARASGRDKYGLWAEFEVKNVQQRMRWIPPGRFVMGSLKEEQGHYENEGPQHQVTLTQGYWLFDTPCTQALWLAVMDGDNPSYFQDPNRPVEQVSFEDVEKFLLKVNGLVNGLNLNLPTEAQWEYACRAGTTASTYAGDLDILGDCNAPVLDPIAWYSGNSGLEYDLEQGVDSIGWPKKQYPHKKAGTRKVGLKLPNSWGLHDMLGNIWEWCDDWWDEKSYTRGDCTNPTGPTAGSKHVVRGGSWSSFARNVRAALRYAYSPVSRYDVLGFRCLSSS